MIQPILTGIFSALVSSAILMVLATWAARKAKKPEFTSDLTIRLQCSKCGHMGAKVWADAPVKP